MAIRLLPFRQYSENDVVNLFALSLDGWGNTDGAAGSTVGANQLNNPFANGVNDAGIFVKVANKNGESMNQDPIVYETNAYLGKTDYPHVGRNQYPTVSLKITACDSGDNALGVTMRQTLTHDENGEKLIYYPQKAVELYAVQTGQAVPVLTRGVVTFDQTAMSPTYGKYGLRPEVGQLITTGPSGTFAPATGLGISVGHPHADNVVVGRVIASGARVARTTKDYFMPDSPNRAGGAGTATGNYYVVQLNCANWG